MHKQPTPVKMPFAKRVFDIIISSIIITILSPVLILIILAIKIEGIFVCKNRGPIFYSEERISAGKLFKLRKFRIFKTSSYYPTQNNGGIVVTKQLEQNLNNLTYIGNILKKFYLDEAPQLFNVLFNNMSMIGPRPWIERDVKKETDKGEFRKIIIKAGLSGPVQIHKLDANKHGGEHKLDNDYIKFVRSHNGVSVVLLDLGIILKSFFFMFKGQGL